MKEIITLSVKAGIWNRDNYSICTSRHVKQIITLSVQVCETEIITLSVKAGIWNRDNYSICEGMYMEQR